MSLNGSLAELTFFSTLPAEIVSKITSIGSEKEYKAKDVVFYQGERANHLYCILKGAVDLIISYEDVEVEIDIIHEDSKTERSRILEKSFVIDRLGPGDILSWSAIVGSGILTATVKCLEDTRLLTIPKEELIALMDKDPAIGYSIMSHLSEVINQRRQKVTNKLVEVWGQYFDKENIEM